MEIVSRLSHVIIEKVNWSLNIQWKIDSTTCEFYKNELIERNWSTGRLTFKYVIVSNWILVLKIPIVF